MAPSRRSCPRLPASILPYLELRDLLTRSYRSRNFGKKVPTSLYRAAARRPEGSSGRGLARPTRSLKPKSQHPEDKTRTTFLKPHAIADPKLGLLLVKLLRCMKVGRLHYGVPCWEEGKLILVHGPRPMTPTLCLDAMRISNRERSRSGCFRGPVEKLRRRRAIRRDRKHQQTSDTGDKSRALRRAPKASLRV